MYCTSDSTSKTGQKDAWTDITLNNKQILGILSVNSEFSKVVV